MENGQFIEDSDTIAAERELRADVSTFADWLEGSRDEARGLSKYFGPISIAELFAVAAKGCDSTPTPEQRLAALDELLARFIDENGPRLISEAAEFAATRFSLMSARERASL